MSKKSAELSRSERARLELERQAADSRRRRLMIAVGVGLLVVAAVVAGYIFTSSSDETGKATSDVPSGLVDGWAVPVGDPEAPMTVTIYEDPQCPVCAAFEAASRDKLDEAVAAGRVKVEYRIVSFLDEASQNNYSSRATNALLVVFETAGAEVFKAYHDTLYSQQPPEGSAGPENAELIDLAVEAGADRDEITQAIEDDVYHQWALNAADEMSKNGVNGTPTVLIDGKMIEPGDPKAALQKLLAALEG